MTRRNPASAANGRRSAGRPPKPAAEKAIVSGKIRVRIDTAREMVVPVDIETRALAQQLMLHEWPGVSRVEELFAYALRQLAEQK